MLLGGSARIRILGAAARGFGALALCVSAAATANNSTLSVADGSANTSSTPVTLLVPVTRSGDLGYAAVLNYHLLDGTAVAGVDYTSGGGAIPLPANASAASIPVTIHGLPGAADTQFQAVLDSAVGIGPAPTFAAQQSFTAGPNPYAAAAADVNGDGKADLLVVSLSGAIVVRLNATAPGATTPSYGAQQAFATGANPHSLSTTDVNGDGRLDLVAANQSDGTVSVLLNTTAPGAAVPTFASQQTFATGSLPTSTTATDVNGDGRPDLVVANYLGNSVSVLLNTTAQGAATASFSAQQTFATGSNPTRVVAADVNGDGEADLIVSNLGGNSVSVLLNATAPGAAAPVFLEQQTLPTGAAPYAVAAADASGDGRPDLVVANYSGNTVSVLFNTTAPGATSVSFSAQKSFATGTQPYCVSATDLNGDGKPDLVASNVGSDSVSVLLNTTVPGAATPSFADQQTFATESQPYCVAAADVNGDGATDLLTANIASNSVSVLLNTTVTGTASLGFAAEQDFATLNAPRGVATADVNGDGRADVIATCSGVGYASVLLNTTAAGATAPSFASQLGFAVGTNPQAVAMADLNGDGRPDMLVGAPGGLAVRLNTTAPGASTPSFGSLQQTAVGSNTLSLVVTDLNGDGKADVVVANNSDAQVTVVLNTIAPGATTTSFSAPRAFATGANPEAVIATDLNGDGRPDVVATNSTDSTFSVLINTTATGASLPSFAAQTAFPSGGSGLPTMAAAADINGDGKPDLIVGNSGNGLAVRLNTTPTGAATPSFTTPQLFTGGTASLQAVVATDVNGDGRPDLVAADFNNLRVLINTTTPGAASASFAAGQTFSGITNFSLALADFNGDNRPDVVSLDNFTNSASVLLNTQYHVALSGGPATGTIVHDYLFADGFGP